MQLVEEGRVGLHQPIADFEPGCGARRRTREDHAVARADAHVGLADLTRATSARKRPERRADDADVIESPLRFEPGTNWEYVSASFYLLTLIIEQAHRHAATASYLDERLQRPLGMHTTFDPRRAGRPIVAVQGVGVDSCLTRFIVLRYMARAALPGGGLFGTLDDMTRFGAALLRPRVVDGRHLPLRAQTIAEMAEDQTKGRVVGVDDEDEQRVHHGLGWGKPTLMRDVPGSKNVFSHGGASGTRMWVDPDAGLVFVFFTNRWAAERSVETEALRGHVRGDEALGDDPPRCARSCAGASWQSIA